MKVFINPGHDVNLDPGAINPIYGTHEADVAAKAGEMLAHYLKLAYCEVKMVQSDELFNEVCTAANDWGADVFVSLHCNASVNHNASGVETLYKSFNGQRLASSIQSSIVRAVGNVCDRGVKHRDELMVLNATDMPAVLVEMGFIDEESDHEMLTGPMLDTIVKAIARGITDYFQ